MLRAYKRKKRELAKIKEQFFKLETEFLQVKEKGKNHEEEMSTM
jgi:predicted transcriptional regulator